MRKFLLLLTLSIINFYCFSQYWQQEVNYKIKVKLNDKEHSLSAYEEIEYINNSPNTLKEIYFHIWPNAYKNNKTELAKQLYELGGNNFVKAKKEDLGWIDSLNFYVNNKKVEFKYDTKHIDICVLKLNEVLNPGERIIITTPFYVKLPNAKFSRLGHVGESYQITQWYPKPAVYDKNGWHAFPYLNQGEFYSENGSYDVSISLPKNYVVGATGDLQTESEKDFLNKKLSESEDFISKKTNYADTLNKKKSRKIIEKANEFPISSEEFKTIRYTQSKIHDFAWFADKRFLVLKGDVVLPHTKAKVDTWSMFTPKNLKLWKKSLEYIHDAVYYYSLWNGDYPYKQVTAIDGTIAAGGGMEYPNVTIIGSAYTDIMLETVIVHEVGHNWFYGILGSNERDHGWMDEGINTLNEMRYMETKYPNNSQLSDNFGGLLHLKGLSHFDQGALGYRLLAHLGEDQAIETKSTDFSALNYGLIMYQKTGLAFHYLKENLGEEKFDKAMQDYFQNWKFKHPQPEDLKTSLEKSTQQNLSWLFDEIIKKTKPVNFKIKKVKQKYDTTTFTIKNKSKANLPVSFQYTTKDSTKLYVSKSFIGKEKIELQEKDVKVVNINPKYNIPEIYTSDNNWYSNKLFHKLEPLKFEFLFGDNEKDKTNIFYTPSFASNSYDKFQLGLAFHNLGIPFKSTQFFISPLYSFDRNKIRGIAEISKTVPVGNFIKLYRFGISAKSFGLEKRTNKDSYYVGLNPYLYFKLGNRSKSPSLSHVILLQGIYRYDQSYSKLPSYTTTYFPKEDNCTNHAGFFVKYQQDFNKKNWLYNSILRIDYLDNVENNDHVFRTSLEITTSVKYIRSKKDKSIELRYFVGNIWSIKNANYHGGNLDYNYAISGANGLQDIFLEEYFFNRSGESINYSLQRIENMGGFKSTSNYGISSTYMHSFNTFIQLPFITKIIGLYGDLGLIPNNTKVESLYQLGVGIRMSKFVGIYFPIYMSDNLEKSYLSKSYLERIRWTIKFNIVNSPIRIKSIM